jgi:hypothetical protein
MKKSVILVVSLFLFFKNTLLLQTCEERADISPEK